MMKVFKNASDIREAVHGLAGELDLLSRDATAPLVLLGVMNGALYFMSDLSRAMTCDHEIQTCNARSYQGDVQTDRMTIKLNWDAEALPLRGRDVIIVDDVLDSGQTTNALIRLISLQQHARSVKLCVLVDKKRSGSLPHFTGFAAGHSDYLVGYGMDSHGLYRNQNFISIKG